MPQLVRVENFAPVKRSAENRADQVIYQSKNSKDKTSFVAYSSPDSPHAAQLAQIALAVQQSDKQEKRRAAPRRGFLSAPISYFQKQIGIVPAPEQPRRLLASGDTYQATTQTAYSYQEVEETDEDWDSTASTQVPETQQQFPSQDDDYETPATAAPVVTTLTYAQQPKVTRLHTEDRISYAVRGANGKLYVSAPTGSSEAQMFDEVARLGSEEPQKQQKERRLVADRRRHRERSRRSSR
ncbi:uncharacterized protein LY89DRAFT_781634 [Mollisia scopiformis]|uniref:Uncharacterized protein n=1 Tax=Mollisia scopiformis TaxID=149040 RepID=A0A194XBA6_MOLSC|nr:uncharacterized protein LY89DRAFT_781634 [Mollisia scopiformis]KUJ17429.1 hypothetical protein LY89DRAFT_781634 [Mollisia scopiformis]